MSKARLKTEHEMALHLRIAELEAERDKLARLCGDMTKAQFDLEIRTAKVEIERDYLKNTLAEYEAGKRDDEAENAELRAALDKLKAALQPFADMGTGLAERILMLTEVNAARSALSAPSEE